MEFTYENITAAAANATEPMLTAEERAGAVAFLEECAEGIYGADMADWALDALHDLGALKIGTCEQCDAPVLDGSDYAECFTRDGDALICEMCIAR